MCVCVCVGVLWSRKIAEFRQWLRTHLCQYGLHQKTQTKPLKAHTGISKNTHVCRWSAIFVEIQKCICWSVWSITVFCWILVLMILYKGNHWAEVRREVRRANRSMFLYTVVWWHKSPLANHWLRSTTLCISFLVKYLIKGAGLDISSNILWKVDFCYTTA